MNNESVTVHCVPGASHQFGFVPECFIPEGLVRLTSECRASPMERYELEVVETYIRQSNGETVSRRFLKHRNGAWEYVGQLKESEARDG